MTEQGIFDPTTRFGIQFCQDTTKWRCTATVYSMVAMNSTSATPLMVVVASGSRTG